MSYGHFIRRAPVQLRGDVLLFMAFRGRAVTARSQISMVSLSAGQQVDVQVLSLKSGQGMHLE
jgi:hypothetical protein